MVVLWAATGPAEGSAKATVTGVRSGVTSEPTAEEKSAEESAEAKLAEEPTAKDQLDDGAPSDVVEVLGGKEGELSAGEQSAGEQSDDRDVVEVPVKELKLRRSTRSSLGKPAEKLSYHAFLPSTSYSTLLNNAEADIDLPELDHDVHANRWDITTMTVKETYAPVGSYVTLRIFLCIVAVLGLHPMQLDMKNAFLQRKLDRVLYMYQSDYYNDETDRVFKLLKSLYGLKQTPLLWYKALDDVLTGADWKKSQVDEALYFKMTRRRSHARIPAEGRLAAVRGDDDEARHRLCVQQVGEWPDGAEQQPLARGRLLSALPCRHPTNGYVFVFSGAAISWTSQRIKSKMLLSTESEYVAATEVGKEACRLRFLLAEFQLLDVGKPTMLHVENQSAITVAEGLGLKGNLKHMDRRYAWL
ncbi:unnamed protein product [Closterium sp. NIES-54]